MTDTETSEISSLLMSVLSNPQAIGKLMESLGKGSVQDNCRQDNTVCEIREECEQDCKHIPDRKCGCDNSEQSKNRRRLIEALEPYLSKERCEAAKKLLLLTELIDSGDCRNGGH